MNHYSPWKYLLLVILIVLGIIYALPNLFGQDYAVQVSASNNGAISTTVANSIADTLSQKNITDLSIANDKNSVLIRFPDIDNQIAAQDALEKSLGNDYAVALNLAPKTPRWLSLLNAEPMKLGLDLRGGIHFLMQVDLDQMLEEMQKTDLSSINDLLRENKIRYASLTSNATHQIRVDFRTKDALNSAKAIVEKNLPTYTVTTTSDSDQDDYTLTAVMTDQSITKVEQDALSLIHI